MPDSYRMCSVDGCEGKHDARGLCSKHYEIFRRENPVAFCSVDGCNKSHKGRGYCETHLRRLRKWGTIEDPIKTERLCSVDGCNNKHEARGYCSLHFIRLRKHGDISICKKGRALSFIKDTVENPPNTCVIWPFGTSFNYGHVRYKGKTVKAHRLALILYSGKDLSDLWALHGPCNNPSCINPKHLRWGTLAENTFDAILAGNRKGLGPEKVREIRLLLPVKSDKELADSFNVSRSTIADIRVNKTWKWVK